jgi:MYXO-CTERM domain-containing protein
MRAWLSFLGILAVCQMLSTFAVSSDAGAESPPLIIDAPINDAGQPVDAAPAVDARVADAPVPANPDDTPEDDGGCSAAGGSPAPGAALLVGILAFALRRKRDRPC